MCDSFSAKDFETTQAPDKPKSKATQQAVIPAKSRNSMKKFLGLC
jgi:hypothetical protein